MHAILLAAALPILITLPAPEADRVGEQIVAIDVEIIEAEQARVVSISAPAAPLVARALVPASPVEPIVGEGDAAPLEVRGSVEAVNAATELEETRIAANAPEPAPATDAMTPEPFEASEITSALPAAPQQTVAPAELSGRQSGSTAIANLGIDSAASAAAAIEQMEPPDESSLSAPLPARKPALEEKRAKPALQEKEKKPAKLKRPEPPKKAAPVQAKPVKPQVRTTAKRKSDDVPYKGPLSGLFAPAPKAGNGKLFQGGR